MKRITVNVRSFEDIRTKGDYIYVDKTQYVYSFVRSELKNYFFISRPRRYGKSLMCSTLQALFEGKRELFKGLYIDKTAKEALEQVKEMGYHQKYVNSKKTIHIIGMNCVSEKRQINEWVEEIVDKVKVGI